MRVNRMFWLPFVQDRISEARFAAVPVTDPTVDTRPWTASIPMTRTGDALYEYACHEGNYSLPLGLSGARADERKLAEEAEKGSR